MHDSEEKFFPKKHDFEENFFSKRHDFERNSFCKKDDFELKIFSSGQILNHISYNASVFELKSSRRDRF